MPRRRNMYKIAKAVSKFYDELHFEGFGSEEVDKLGTLFFQELVAEARDTGSLLDEDSEEEDAGNEGEIGPIATAYVDVRPNFSKLQAALDRLKA